MFFFKCVYSQVVGKTKHNVNKYNAIKIYYCLSKNVFSIQRPPDALDKKDFLTFDSRWEFEVYQKIRGYFQAEWVQQEPKLVLKPSGYYSASVTYCPDFLIIDPNSTHDPTSLKLENGTVTPYLFVEAKGVMTSEAKLKLSMLELTHPVQRSNLIVVSEKGNYYFGKLYPQSHNLTKLGNCLALLKRSIRENLTTSCNNDT